VKTTRALTKKVVLKNLAQTTSLGVVVDQAMEVNLEAALAVALIVAQEVEAAPTMKVVRKEEATKIKRKKTKNNQFSPSQALDLRESTMMS